MRKFRLFWVGAILALLTGCSSAFDSNNNNTISNKNSNISVGLDLSGLDTKAVNKSVSSSSRAGGDNTEGMDNAADDSAGSNTR